MAQRFTSVLAVLGTPTDDCRVLAADIDLGFRDNMPLLWQKETSSEGHAGSVPVGVIESARIEGSQVVGEGFFLTNEDAADVQEQIRESLGKFPNPSVDLGDMTITFTDEAGNPVAMDDELAPDAKVYMTATAAKLLGATLVAIPAFGQTSITVADAPAAADESMPPTEEDEEPLVASVEPDRYAKAAFTVPEPDHAVPIHFTADGRVMGHLAEWNRPHRAFSNRRPPRSASQYSDFHQSHVYLDNGDILRVGRLTVGGGHGPCGQGVRAALAHYDDVATTWAYVRAVDGKYGIWICGVVNPRADEDMVREAMSAPHSGHWEKVAGRAELIAAHAVVVPGLPIYTAKTDAHGNDLALVASAFAPMPGDPAAAPPADADEPAAVTEDDKKFLTTLSDQLGAIADTAGGYAGENEAVAGIAKSVADAATGLSEKISAVVAEPAPEKPTEEAGLTAAAVSEIAKSAVTEYRRQEQLDRATQAERLRSNQRRVEAMGILRETGIRRRARAAGFLAGRRR